MNERIIEIFKTFNWDQIFKDINALEDFNQPTRRSAKGELLQLRVGDLSNGNLITGIEGIDRFDFKTSGELKENGINDVELKTLSSNSLFAPKSKKMRKRIVIRYKNVLGKNKKKKELEIVQYLIAIYNDGAVLIDENTIRRYNKKTKDCIMIDCPSRKVFLLAKTETPQKKSLNIYSRMMTLGKDILIEENSPPNMQP